MALHVHSYWCTALAFIWLCNAASSCHSHNQVTSLCTVHVAKGKPWVCCGDAIYRGSRKPQGKLLHAAQESSPCAAYSLQPHRASRAGMFWTFPGTCHVPCPARTHMCSPTNPWSMVIYRPKNMYCMVNYLVHNLYPPCAYNRT